MGCSGSTAHSNSLCLSPLPCCPPNRCSAPFTEPVLVPTVAVTLKVHVSDASTHQPIPEALIEVFNNQVAIASGTSGTDGVAFIRFQYKLGTPLMVTATKHAYVPNSAPWKPVRLPGEWDPAGLGQLTECLELELALVLA